MNISSPSPTVWFLSHRKHYDPRIYNIMSVYRAHGWHTVLFDPPPDQLRALEWAELVEEPWQPVFNVEMWGADLQSVGEEVGEFLTDLQANDRVYRGQAETGIKRRGNLNYQVSIDSETYYATFSRVGGGDRYVYDLDHHMLWHAPATCGLPELAGLHISELLRDGGVVSDAVVSKLPDVVLTETDREYILTRQSGYEPGREVSIDKQTYLVRSRALGRRYHYAVDEFLGRSYDYSAFKSDVYEYIWELDLISAHLKTAGCRKPDVVVVSDLPTLPVGVILKETFGCKLVIDCHEWWSEQERIWNPKAGEKLAAIDYWEKQLYSRCDVALTVSKTLAEVMSTHFGMPFQYVPTCVFDLPQLPERVPGFWQDAAGLPEGASVVLFQGGLSTNRNLETLMRATKYFADGQYLVVCGDGAFMHDMKAILEAEGWPERVRLLGWQPQLDLWKYTMHADLGIIPYSHALRYYQLSAPNKLSEFHICELPMLVDKGMIELTNIVTEDNVGRAEDLSTPESMGKAIASMLSDKAALAAYKANYRTAIKRFTRAQCEVYLEPILKITTSQ